MTARDEMMNRAEVAVRDFEAASSDLSLSYTDAYDALMEAFGACLDWVPDCDGCVNLGSTEPASIVACRYCPRNAVYHDHYAPADLGEGD